MSQRLAAFPVSSNDIVESIAASVVTTPRKTSVDNSINPRITSVDNSGNLPPKHPQKESTPSTEPASERSTPPLTQVRGRMPSFLTLKMPNNGPTDVYTGTPVNPSDQLDSRRSSVSRMANQTVKDLRKGVRNVTDTTKKATQQVKDRTVDMGAQMRGVTKGASKWVANQTSKTAKAAMEQAKSGLSIGEKFTLFASEKITVLSRKGFTHVFMFLILVGYTALGALLFMACEAPNEEKYKIAIVKERKILTESLWEKRDSNYDDFSRNVKVLLEPYEDELYGAFSAGVSSNTDERTWTFWKSMFFCSTITTTIGYGHMAPKTTAGRALTIVYAIIGIPIFLILMADFGKLFTRLLKHLFVFINRVYKSGTCVRARTHPTVQKLRRSITERSPYYMEQYKVSKIMEQDLVDHTGESCIITDSETEQLEQFETEQFEDGQTEQTGHSYRLNTTELTGQLETGQTEQIGQLGRQNTTEQTGQSYELNTTEQSGQVEAGQSGQSGRQKTTEQSGQLDTGQIGQNGQSGTQKTTEQSGQAGQFHKLNTTEQSGQLEAGQTGQIGQSGRQKTTEQSGQSEQSSAKLNTNNDQQHFVHASITYSPNCQQEEQPKSEYQHKVDELVFQRLERSDRQKHGQKHGHECKLQKNKDQTTTTTKMQKPINNSSISTNILANNEEIKSRNSSARYSYGSDYSADIVFINEEIADTSNADSEYLSANTKEDVRREQNIAMLSNVTKSPKQKIQILDISRRASGGFGSLKNRFTRWRTRAAEQDPETPPPAKSSPHSQSPHSHSRPTSPSQEGGGSGFVVGSMGSPGVIVEEYLNDDNFDLPISLALFILLVYIIMGCFIYISWEHWTFFEAFYFIFVSMTTIGFGDFVPEHPAFMMATALYLVFGLALTAMCINIIQEKLSNTFREASTKLKASFSKIMENAQAGQESFDGPHISGPIILPKGGQGSESAHNLTHLDG